MPGSPPKISIITPTLNVSHLVEKMLMSVSSQTYPNIEHIIVDGDSSDGTLQLIKEYQKKYGIIKFISEKDTGVYHAMNKGLDLCTGSWIYFLGADDTFYADNILMELYSDGFFDEEAVVYGNVFVNGEAGWSRDSHIYDGRFDLQKLLIKNICHQGIFYPKSVISRAGYYNEKYSVTADWDYNLRCWTKYKFLYADKIIAFFQAGGVSSKGGDIEFADDRPGNIIRYFNLDPDSSEYDDPDSPFHKMVSLYRKKNMDKK